MKKLNHAIARSSIALAVIGLASCFSGYADKQPSVGNQYEIIHPIYLMAVYNSLNNRQVSRETARAHLHSRRYYDKSWVAFQCEVPVGTIMTIISQAPKVWHLPFLPNRYFIRLDPDPSQGLDVILELSRRMEGSLDGLNPELFEQMK